MEIDYQGVRNILVLGAGASVEYGLPAWVKLGELIKKKVTANIDQYAHGKEIIAWIDKVGDEKQYRSIDACIAKESIAREYHSSGPEIENEIFRVMREIFIDSYSENEEGWIRLLNEKILQNPPVASSLAFINYNYDNVLDRNFLNFDYLSEKERRLSYKVILAGLSKVVREVFHPHGFLFFDTPDDHILHISKSKHTIKTGDSDFHDVVSCYDSYNHSVINGSYSSTPNGNLYILGLGGGLEVNLSKINFKVQFREIHVTIHDEKRKEGVLTFLSEIYNISPSEIKVYSTCKELIENCF